MLNNPILNELYEIRSRILAEHPLNLREYLDAVTRRLKTDGHPVARVQQRSIRRLEEVQPSSLVTIGHAE